MKIMNIEGLSADDLQREVSKGARFIYYPYTVSLIVLTFKRTSGVYLVRAEENAVARGFIFIMFSVLFGWWGIPWGPRHTWNSIRINLRGGKNVTDEVMSVVEGYALFESVQKKRSA